MSGRPAHLHRRRGWEEPGGVRLGQSGGRLLVDVDAPHLAAVAEQPLQARLPGG